MYARVTTLETAPDQFDEVVRIYRDIVVPFTTAQAGCKGVHLLADHQSGRVLTISLWESTAAMEASEDMAAGMRAQSRIAGHSPERVDRYEVVG